MFSGHDLDLPRSHDIIGHLTIRLAVGGLPCFIDTRNPFSGTLLRCWASNVSLL